MPAARFDGEESSSDDRFDVPFDDEDADASEPEFITYDEGDEEEEWADEDNPDPYASPDVEESDSEPAAWGRGDGMDWVTQTSRKLDPPAKDISEAHARMIDEYRSVVRRISAIRLRFRYDVLSTAAYVLVASDEADFSSATEQDVARLLVGAGLRVGSSGPSRFPASDGLQYQQFFRVATSGGKQPAPSLLTRLFEEVRFQKPTPPPPPLASQKDVRSAEDLSADQRSADLREIASTAFREINAAEMRASVAERALSHRTQQDARRQSMAREKLAETEEIVFAALAIARRRLAALPQEARRSEEREEFLTAQLRIARDAKVDAEESKLRAEEAALDILAREIELEGRNKELELQIASAEFSHQAVSTSEVVWNTDFRVRPKSANEELIASMFPTLGFERDSIPLLLVELDCAAWSQELAHLVIDEKAFRESIAKRGSVERVVTRPGWWEVRRNRSANDMSRLYYKADDRSATRGYRIRLQMKKNDREQKRFIQTLD